MRKPTAALGSALFLLLAPGALTVLVPWWVTGWHVRPAPDGWVVARAVGALMVLVGASFVVSAFVRFVREGLGTPAPVAPPTRLVVGGVYRYVRNPMYLAVTTIVVGEALLLNQPSLLLVAAVAFLAMVAFARFYEEPALTRRFGAEYERYRATVPGWWPRRRPWTPSEP